jgi:hypothetical protein
MSLCLLDNWMTGQTPGALPALLKRTRVPAGHWTAERAATDVLVLAGKGRAFRSLQTLITRQGSHQLLPGGALALAVATKAWPTSPAYSKTLSCVRSSGDYADPSVALTG